MTHPRGRPAEMPQEHFVSELRELLEELFDVHHGLFLDRGTSLFATLDGISAAAASRPIAGGNVSIAAHVEHVILYIDVLGRHMSGEPAGQVDWTEIWNRVGAVDEEEWASIRKRLRDRYVWLVAAVEGVEDWRENDAVGASMMILAHTACHLGVIRQAVAQMDRKE